MAGGCGQTVVAFLFKCAKGRRMMSNLFMPHSDKTLDDFEVRGTAIAVMKPVSTLAKPPRTKVRQPYSENSGNDV
jgi:hypothetical protein